MKVASDVENALDRLPETLAELYALTYEQVKQTEPDGRYIAIRTLQWLLCAHIPLSTGQMIDMVSPPSRLLYSDQITSVDLLNVCCNLVVLDHELDCFRFAHVSVRDFFDGQTGFENDTVHTMAVDRCLDLYSMEPLDCVRGSYGPFQSKPCFEYAARYWIVHYSCIKQRVPSLGERAKDFFVRGRLVPDTCQFWILYIHDSADLLDPYDPLREKFADVAAQGDQTPLFVACVFGILDLLRCCEVIDGFNWFQRNVNSLTALHVAARYGFVDGIRFLLEKGLGVDTLTDCGESALHIAVNGQHFSTACQLLEDGASVHFRDIEDWTAFDHATKHRHAQMVMLLLQYGAKPEAEAKYGQTIANWDDGSGQGLQRLYTALGRPTGYIGILNEGQTGFLNTDLQIFRMLRPVRKVGSFQVCSNIGLSVEK